MIIALILAAILFLALRDSRATAKRLRADLRQSRGATRRAQRDVYALCAMLREAERALTQHERATHDCHDAAIHHAGQRLAAQAEAFLRQRNGGVL